MCSQCYIQQWQNNTAMQDGGKLVQPCNMTDTAMQDDRKISTAMQGGGKSNTAMQDGGNNIQPCMMAEKQYSHARWRKYNTAMQDGGKIQYSHA